MARKRKTEPKQAAPAAGDGALTEEKNVTQEQGKQGAESAAAQGRGDPDPARGAPDLGEHGAEAGAPEPAISGVCDVEVEATRFGETLDELAGQTVDAMAYQVTGIVRDMDLPEQNAMAAYMAAGMVYGGGVDFNSGFAGLHWSVAGRKLALAAAAFVRAHPEAPAEAVAIHLRMKGFGHVPEPGRRELVAWSVFAFTLKALDGADAADRADQAAADARAAARRPSAPASKLARLPQPGPRDVTGFQRRR